jgi:adenosylcobinamide-GDP ribazoletransferase
MRGLILAIQFLTRLPTPQVRDFEPRMLAEAAPWFPAVGALVGLLVWSALWAGAHIDPWVGGLVATVAWIGVTGALHVDGLADLADALGASHRDPARFLEVLKDPHTGTFGVVAIVLLVAAKLVLLARVGWSDGGAALLILCAAWGRFGAVAWSQTLPSLTGGSAERFAWQASPGGIGAWGVVLVGASAWAVPALAIAGPLALIAWWAWLRARLGGMTGDCLGAGVELVEVALLLVGVAAL